MVRSGMLSPLVTSRYREASSHEVTALPMRLARIAVREQTLDILILSLALLRISLLLHHFCGDGSSGRVVNTRVAVSLAI